MTFLAAALVFAVLPAPSDWVPARWPSSDPATLDLVRGTPVNCLILEHSKWSAPFVKAASDAGVATLGMVDSASVLEARTDVASKIGLTGLVLNGTVGSSAPGHANLTVVQLTNRSALPFGQRGISYIPGTDQGLWPGIHPEDKGATHASASGSVWIDTNAGFLRYAHAALQDTVLWMGNQPPEATVYPIERYLQAIADSASNGARWILAFDSDFTGRLMARDPKALKDWARVTGLLAFYESHKEWRNLSAYAKLALVESPATGALLSGGVLDMIATKHTPVRPIPADKVAKGQFDGAQMAVNIDPDALNAEQKEALKAFTRGGGTLLSGPPGWRFPDLKPGQITLGKDDTEKLDQIWKELNAMTGRTNLGARLFNVSTVLSNLTGSADGKQVVLHLVNYGDFAVDSITVHLLGEYKKATLYRPESPKGVNLELYKTDEGSGLDVDQMSTVAVVVLEP